MSAARLAGETILVTGGAGFVGRHLLPALMARFPECRLRVLDLRPPACDVRVEFAVGDLQDRAAVEAAVAGASVVVHLAAKVEPDARDVDALARVNVDGTRTVLAAARAAGCAHFVHMSSAGVYGPPRDGPPFCETDDARPTTPYQRTKLEAERLLAAVPGGSMVVNVLRPAGIYGSWSFLELPTYRRLARQRWSVEQAGGVVVHPTHVTDVVGAIVALVGHPAAHGATFNVGGERPVLLQALHELTAAALGAARRRRVVIAPALAGPAAAVAAPILALAGRPRPRLRDFCRGRTVTCAVDDRAFRRDYPDVPVLSLDAGVREHVGWARAEGLV